MYYNKQHIYTEERHKKSLKHCSIEVGKEPKRLHLKSDSKC